MGFRVIQIHAAHGYFLSQLLDSRINKRSDEYGRNPILIIKRIVTAINSIDRNVAVDLRLSLIDGFEDQKVEYIRKLTILDRLVDIGLDIISISNGHYDFNKYLIYPPKERGHGPYIDLIVPLANKYPFLLWNIAGNIWDIRKLPPEIPKNLTFSIGRALIADPDLLQKSFSNDFENIRWCTREGDCHYYIKGRTNIFCPFDPSLSNNDTILGNCMK